MKEENIERVAVIGAGLMGFGIGVEFARFGYQVSLYNTKEASSKKAMENAREALDLMVETQLLTAEEGKAAYGRLRPTTDLMDAASGADYVIESISEILSLKQEIFAKLDEICPPPAILVTDTSDLLVTDIAARAKHPERILATHYFQPPHFVPLVEVVGGERTERRAVELVARVLRGLRKKVVIIDIELPGFAGNRIQGAIKREIQSLVDQGVCSPSMIDDIISFGFGRRLACTAWFKRSDLYWTRAAFGGVDMRGEKQKGYYDWPGDTAKQLDRRTSIELIGLMKRDMDEGSI